MANHQKWFSSGVIRKYAAASAMMGAALSAGGTAWAQTVTDGSSGCLVQEASNAALQRRLAEIDATKTNVNSFFNGSNSCISSNLLNNLDLSTLIPDLGGLLSQGLSGVAQNLLNNAEQQVCQIANGEITGVISSLNNEMTQYNSSVGSKMATILGASQFIQVPSISGFGSYSMTTPTLGSIAAPEAVNVTPNSVGSTINSLLSSPSGTSSSSTSSQASASSVTQRGSAMY